MNAKNIHRLTGIVMLLPLLVWCVTGAIFVFKPSYGSAYEKLTIKNYPLERTITLQSIEPWHEIRQVRSILGQHLLVRTNKHWQQLDPITQRVRTYPSKEQLHLLLTDAITTNPQRYGDISSINNNTAITSTDVVLSFNWDDLSIKQKGNDTRLIAQLYQLHYLQWTNNDTINALLEIIGLSLLIVLSSLGTWLVFVKKSTVPATIKQQ